MLVLTVFLSKFLTDGFATNIDEIKLSMIEYFGEEFLQNHAQAQIKHDQLMALLFTEDELKLSDFERIYPDFIGGLYYNYNGFLTVQIVKNSTPYKQMINFFDDNEDVIVEYVDFSQNELTATIDTLNVLILAHDGQIEFDNVTSFGIDTKNNSVVVDLIVYTEEEITRFRENVLDSPMIVFAESSGSYVYFNDNTDSINHLLVLLIVLGTCLLVGLSLLLWIKQKGNKTK